MTNELRGQFRSIKPWLWQDGTVLHCLVCGTPMGGTWAHRPRTRAGLARAIKMHQHCGLEPPRAPQ